MNTLWPKRPARTEGDRPAVIALHTGAGSPEQWRPLAKRLRLRYRVLAPELHGYAAGRASGAHEPLSLEAEAARIEPLLDAFPGPVYLVGQDYGAAVALKLAHRRRERIVGLVLYEPTPFGLLLANPGSRVAALDIAVLGRVLWRYLERALGSGPLGAMWSTARARTPGRACHSRSGRRSPGACRSYARRWAPKLRIRRRSPGTPGSTYRYGS